jgi:hypothetical protein
MRLALALLLTTPLLSACPRRDGATLAPALDAAKLFDQIKAAHARPETLTADAKAFVDAPQNGGRYALHVSVRRPASLRIEALTPLGDPAAVLVADAGRFALFDLRRNEFYRGPSTPENLSRLFPVPLRDDELVALFLGGVPELPSAQPVSAAREGDHYKLVLSTVPEGLSTVRGLAQEVLVHEGDLRILGVTRLVAGGEPQPPLWSVVLEEHDDKSGAELPRIIKLSVPAQKIGLDLRLREMLVGKPPPFGAFALQPPAGVQIIDLD